MAQAVCQSCGNYVSETARFCPRCGGSVAAWTPPSAVEQPYSQQPPYQQPYQQPQYQQPPYQQAPYQPPSYPQPYYQQQSYGAAPGYSPAYVERKDKTVALLLAIFLGFWTWIYTYKKDAWKFWLTLALNITIFNPIWTWLLLFLPNFALHIWAIVDVAVKPQYFYDNYPNA